MTQGMDTGAVAAQAHFAADLVPRVTFADPCMPAPAWASPVLGTLLSLQGPPPHATPADAVMYAHAKAVATALAGQDVEVDRATTGTAPAEPSHAAAQATPAKYFVVVVARMQGVTSSPTEDDLTAAEATWDTGPAVANACA
jgi:hypothetical protein